MGHDRYMRRLEKDQENGRGLFLDNLMKLLVDELPEAEKHFATCFAGGLKAEDAGQWLSLGMSFRI